MMVENVLYIDAPQRVVWGVTLDIERWPQWTPTVKSIHRLDEGPFGRGSAALIRQPGLPKRTWVVTELIPGERFTWETRILGMRMIATHELLSRDTGTQSILRVEMSGLVARLLSPVMRFSVRRAIEQENAGLKAKCESLVRK